MIEKGMQFLAFSPLEKQKEFLENPAKWRCFMGGWGAGKTYAGIMESIRCSIQYATTGLIARKTWRELKQSTLDVFWQLCPPILITEHDEEDGVIQIRNSQGSQSTIFYSPLDKREKIEGMNLGWWYVDEACEVEEEFFLALLGRCRHPGGPQRGWLTTTPPSISHWIHKYFVERKDKDFALIRATSYDNPTLSQSYLASLESTLPDHMKRRYLYAQFGVETKGVPVYGSEYRPHLHIREALISKTRPVYRGIDFGWHRPAMVAGQLDEFGRLVIYEEFLGTAMGIETFIGKIKSICEAKFGNRVIYIDFVDPHGSQVSDLMVKDRYQIMVENGLSPIPVYLPIGEGILLVQRLLSTLRGGIPLLTFSPSCRMLIEAMEIGYAWDDKEGTKIVKTGIYEHLADALRYLCVGVFENYFPATKAMPIKSVLGYEERISTS